MASFKDSIQDVSAEMRPSGWILVAANCIPLLGVYLWGWSTFAIVAIYWAENVVLGAINLLKMLFCNPTAATLEKAFDEIGDGNEDLRKQLEKFKTSSGMNHASKLFFLPFFTVHYGMFCFVHGVFVFTLFGHEDIDFPSPWAMFEKLHREGLLWAVGGLALSHFLSFLFNYLWKGEYQLNTLPQLMIQPYGRIVILHLAILLGGFVTMALGSPIIVLLILIVGKTLLDLGFHLMEHKKYSDEQRDNYEDHQHRGNEGFGAGA